MATCSLSIEANPGQGHQLEVITLSARREWRGGRSPAPPIAAIDGAPHIRIMRLERDQEKWSPVFRPDRATNKGIESGQGAKMAPMKVKPL